MEDRKEHLRQELEKHREAKEKYEEESDKMVKELEGLDPRSEPGSSEQQNVIWLLGQLDKSSKEGWEHRIRSQEIMAALAQIELGEQAGEVLEEIRSHTQAMNEHAKETKAHTQATRDSILEGEKQTKLMIRLTWAVTAMTAAILAATVYLALSM